jgi:hypothetical protein
MLKLSCSAYRSFQREEGKDMNRARLAFLTLAGSLLTITGCSSMCENECQTGGWFQRFHLASRNVGGAPCDCCGGGGNPMASSDGTMVIPPNATMPPGTFTAPPPAVMTNPPPVPGSIQPPRVVPIPQQASPIPYTPG